MMLAEVKALAIPIKDTQAGVRGYTISFRCIGLEGRLK